MAASTQTHLHLYFWPLAAAITLFKLLLIPAYHSTDFEVHRNWLAITNSLPISKWYYESTSEWTLDYPPFFGWLEFLLSQVAKLFDPQMLVLTNLNYESQMTVVFQRMSVIMTDFVFIYATKEYCIHLSRSRPKETASILAQPSFAVTLFLLWNFGLLVVDHIHFQYNGFLTGILLLSITRISQNRFLEGGFWFSVLLNFKHIYLYIAPAYFIYLLRCYCFTKSKADGRVVWTSLSFGRLSALGLIVISVFALSFGPFIYMNQIPQVLSRLFPFKRGLCHAYWAPNFWALYNVIDKVATVVGTKIGLLSVGSTTAAMTGGLVQEFQHTLLPSVPPLVTFVLTAVSMLPSLWHQWRYPSGVNGFLRCLTICAFCSFMFGWHVHEKAIILITIPLSLLAVEGYRDAQVFLFLSTIGHYSLFPLIFKPAEAPIKVCLLLISTFSSLIVLSGIYKDPKTYRLPHIAFLSPLESIYILGLLPLYFYCNLVHYLLGLGEKLAFFPLMLTSVYCAAGVSWAWLKFYYNSLKREGKIHSQKDKRI
ncbi:dolichyl pyrophosphate Glc1Man9GlcNAc2 alpha-1,3-glucosyltransferase-like [Antedon mediterranea]|uniref:dolichyl pyrophosphate Glc1Man9GlcNAc2 alpha-1,3-glucosyltransferase-like n=1 Tax=Antedon mediterranea TaxID=105859 RepID=UPI003AF9298A